jgi:hypothetical protein
VLGLISNDKCIFTNPAIPRYASFEGVGNNNIILNSIVVIILEPNRTLNLIIIVVNWSSMI